MSKQLKIVLKKSTIGSTPKHRKIIQALGLKKPHQIVIHRNTAVIKGMVDKVRHLVEIVEE